MNSQSDNQNPSSGVGETSPDILTQVDGSQETSEDTPVPGTSGTNGGNPVLGDAASLFEFIVPHQTPFVWPGSSFRSATPGTDALISAGLAATYYTPYPQRPAGAGRMMLIRPPIASTTFPFVVRPRPPLTYNAPRISTRSPGPFGTGTTDPRQAFGHGPNFVTPGILTPTARTTLRNPGVIQRPALPVHPNPIRFANENMTQSELEDLAADFMDFSDTESEEEDTTLELEPPNPLLTPGSTISDSPPSASTTLVEQKAEKLEELWFQGQQDKAEGSDSVKKLEEAAHEKRLKELREQVKYLDQTAWKYDSIDKILGKQQNHK